MKTLLLILLIPIVFSFQNIFAQNAPISTIENVVDYGTTAVVPITVTDFIGIGGCEFILNFDPGIVTIASVTKGPGVSSMYWLADETSPGVFKVAWMFFEYNVPGLTLADNAVFMNINVQKVASGYSPITFDHSLPYNCVYYDGGFIYLNDTPKSDYYIDGSITFASGGTQWTGSIDDDWSDAQNWDAGVPGATSIAIINDVSPNLFPSANTNAECLGLDIASGASVVIPASSALTVYGNFNNNGLLTVGSTNVGDGSFINNGTISGTGTVKVERYLTSEMWHYVSPPISDGLSGIFLDIYLMEWDEPTGMWLEIVPVNKGLNPMQGYGTWADDDLTGTTTVYYESSAQNLNSGSYNSGVLTADGPDDPSPGSGTSRGFNFVGNPYPSAIDWDNGSGWTKTDLANAIYIWNPANANYGSYVNSLSTNGVTNIIPGGQGFYVHVPIDFSTGSLTVNNNARLHDPKPFFKNIESDQQSISLAISSDINMYSDEAIIGFNESATTNFDPSADASNLEGSDEAPDIYSISADAKKLSINTYPELDENVVIPLGCKVGIDGYYTIETLSILNFSENVEILLEDKFENEMVDLKVMSYTFFGNTFDDPERFNLHFLANPDNTIEISGNLDVRLYAVNNTIYLKSQGSKILEGNLEVFDILGRLIVSNPIVGEYQYKLPLDGHGIFIVTYFDNSEQKVYRQKVNLN